MQKKLQECTFQDRTTFVYPKNTVFKDKVNINSQRSSQGNQSSLKGNANVNTENIMADKPPLSRNAKPQINT